MLHETSLIFQLSRIRGGGGRRKRMNEYEKEKVRGKE
jgi:hypothetical protein